MSHPWARDPWLRPTRSRKGAGYRIAMMDYTEATLDYTDGPRFAYVFDADPDRMYVEDGGGQIVFTRVVNPPSWITDML